MKENVMAGHWVRMGRPLLLLSLVLVLLAGCGTEPTPEPQPTPTAGLRILMPTPGTPPPSPLRSPTPLYIIYIVQAGDTLYDIAIRYGVDMDLLIELNGLSDPNALQIGQELKIPVEQPEATATPLTPTISP